MEVISCLTCLSFAVCEDKVVKGRALLVKLSEIRPNFFEVIAKDCDYWYTDERRDVLRQVVDAVKDGNIVILYTDGGKDFAVRVVCKDPTSANIALAEEHVIALARFKGG